MYHAYIRVSGGEQGLSLEDQQTRIRKYANYHSITVHNWYIDDHVSGKRLLSSRPEGHKLTAALEDGDTILITQLDRAFRNLADGSQMEKEWSRRKIKIIIVDDGGQLIETDTCPGWQSFIMKLFIAETESRLASDRTRKAKAARRAMGYHVSGATPYGYDKQKKGKEKGKLSLNESEQKWIRYMIGLRKLGNNFNTIARKLNEAGCKPKKAKKWCDSSVESVLKREMDPTHGIHISLGKKTTT